MTPNSHEEHYHGADITAEELGKTGDHDRWLFRAHTGDTLLFRLILGVTGTASALDFGGRASGSEVARRAGLKRVHAMLDLKTYEPGRQYEHWLTSLPDEPPTMPDEEVRHLIMSALYNIYRAVPLDAKKSQLDVEGLCAYTGLPLERFLFNAAVLRDQGLIAESVSSSGAIPEGKIYLSPQGLSLFEKTALLSDSLDKLFHEVRIHVDSRLTQVVPEAAAKLADTYADMAAGRTSLKWKQVAVACRDILQDFTDVILLPEYVPSGAERPPRDKTKNKLALALTGISQHKPVDATTSNFLLAQCEFLLGYFDAFNDLVQKGVHIPSTSRHLAQMCLIHTYIFIGDTIALLDT